MSGPLRLFHDDPSRPAATVRVAEAAPGAQDSPERWGQLATYWAQHAGVAYWVDDKSSSDASCPSTSAPGSLYTLWSAQLIGQVDVECIEGFKAALPSFRPAPAPAPGSAPSHAGEALYCRYLLVRRSDGGLVSGNAARALIGWQALPPVPPGLSPAQAREREVAHDQAQFEAWAKHGGRHVTLADSLPDYFIFVLCKSQYFFLRFGAVVLTVGEGQPRGAPTGQASAPALPAGTAADAETSPGFFFLALQEDDCTLVTLVEPLAGAGGGYSVPEEPPAEGERRLAEAGFYTQEGTNAASMALPCQEVVALLLSWGWAQVSEADLLA